MLRPLSYLEISRGNLLHNVGLFRSVLNSGQQLAAVVKANAYGHGLKEVAEVLQPVVDYFQIDDIEELESLRRIVKTKPVLVFGYVPRSSLAEALRLRAIFTGYDLDWLKALNKIARQAGRPAAVHIKIDAELGRQGVLPKDLPGFLRGLARLRHLAIQGIYAHLADADEDPALRHAKRQAGLLAQAKQLFEKHGYQNLKTHITATAATLAQDRLPGRYDIVRVGLGLYGLWPAPWLKRDYGSRNFQLRPVLRWVSHLVQVKTLPARWPVGYGLTYRTSKLTRIGLVPQGYGDGYDRQLSNRGEVLVQGQRCRILGRVAMNMMTVKLDGKSVVKPEQEVVLLGQQGREAITAEELAGNRTINYEITTRLSPLLPRFIID